MISGTVIPVLLYEKEYIKLIVVLGIITFMMALSVWLYSGFFAAAKEFIISETGISFVYDDYSEKVNCCDISKIIITPMRYIFYGEKKHTVTRIEGPFKAEGIDPRIHSFSESFIIPCLKKFV